MGAKAQKNVKTDVTQVKLRMAGAKLRQLESVVRCHMARMGPVMMSKPVMAGKGATG